MAATISPEAQRLAAALSKRLGDGSFTARELDESVWGSAPTEEELTEARRVAARTHGDALGAVLVEARTRQEAAELLGISAQAVSKRHSAGTLVALSRGRELRFPAWQFYEGSTRPGLAEVIAGYPGGSLSLSNWAVVPNADLDGLTPAEALARRGGVERVLAVLEAISPDAW